MTILEMCKKLKDQEGADFFAHIYRTENGYLFIACLSDGKVCKDDRMYLINYDGDIVYQGTFAIKNAGSKLSDEIIPDEFAVKS